MAQPIATTTPAAGAAAPHPAERPHEAGAHGTPPSADAGFWELFARQHRGELDRCVTSALRSVGWRPQRADVEDLVQEIYYRLLTHRSPCHPLAGRPRAQQWRYLQRMARSVVVDMLRNRGAAKRGGGASGPTPVCITVEEPLAPGLNLEEDLLCRERATELRRRVHELSQDDQGERNWRILELAAVEGLTCGEISQHFGGALAPSSVHTVLHRLRRQLARRPAPDAMVSSVLAAVG